MKTSFLTVLAVTFAVAFGKNDKKTETSTYTALSTSAAYETETSTSAYATLITSSAYETSTLTSAYATLSASSGFVTSTYPALSVKYSVTSSRAIKSTPTPPPAPVCQTSYTPLCCETSDKKQTKKTTENPKKAPISIQDFDDQCSSVGMTAQCCTPDGNSDNMKCSPPNATPAPKKNNG